MNRALKYHIDHILFWVTTVAFHLFTRLSLIEKVGVGAFLSEVVIRNSLLACIIYFNLMILIPRFARRKKWTLYFVFLLFAFLFYVGMKNTHDVYLYGHLGGNAAYLDFFYNTFYNFSIALFYMAFSVALQLSREWFEQRELIQKIEVEKLSTELDYLKAQLNPHFLFNSINTIFFQIDKENKAARETLSAFSDMLRYQLYECNDKEIPLEKEVNYLKNYMDLQRQRCDDNYWISFSYNDVDESHIAPLLLIPFVENAFKHVSHFPRDNEVRVDIHKNGNALKMMVFNTCDPGLIAQKNGHGIGLKNVQRRLELLYQNRFRLKVNRSSESYQVNLEIILSES
jgi:LytS/YehU family sensor histidine kinase